MPAKVLNAMAPTFGPRGGMIMMGSITVIDDEFVAPNLAGNLVPPQVWLKVSLPPSQKWTPFHAALQRKIEEAIGGIK